MPEMQTKRVIRSGKLFSPAVKWALFIGVAIHVAGFLMFRVDSNKLPERDAKSPFVAFIPDRILNEDLVLTEQAVLFDSAPLFIPNEWSSVSSGRPSIPSVPEELLSVFKPDITLSPPFENSLHSEVSHLEDLLERPPLDQFSSWGMQPLERIPELEGWDSVARVFTGDHLADVSFELDEIELGSLSNPAALSTEGAVRFGLRISADGVLLVPPFVIQSSGTTAFDRDLAELLVEPERLGRLPRGYSEVEIYL